MDNNEVRIVDFEKYLIEQLESIENLSAPKHETLFKKKLYISFLESLAKATFPEEGVKRRFLNFLKDFTQWEEWNYCCPVHLEDKEKIQNILDRKRYVNIKSVAIQPENIDDCKGAYAYLLYEARNSMVHQIQSSTEWEESTQRHNIESPFYQVVTYLVDDRKEIELIFPNTFLKKLSENGLKNFIKDCKNNKINPFINYYAERKIYEEKI